VFTADGADTNALASAEGDVCSLPLLRRVGRSNENAGCPLHPASSLHSASNHCHWIDMPFDRLNVAAVQNAAALRYHAW
jgi:hypothetical protein